MYFYTTQKYYHSLLSLGDGDDELRRRGEGGISERGEEGSRISDLYMVS